MRRMLCLNFMPLWEAGETDLHHTFNIGGKTHALWLSRSSEGYRLELAGGWSGPVALVEKRKGEARLIVDGRSEPIVYVHDGDLVHVHLAGQSYVVRYIDALVALSGVADDAGHNVARAPMPGVVLSVRVSVGERVVAGTVIAIIESMKLETAIRASQDGIVEKIHVKDGESFDRDAALVTLSQEGS
jgi:acetyl/propionyl-CoA carboxylase alpha subunit